MRRETELAPPALAVSSLLELLQLRARYEPDHLAYLFLRDGDTGEDRLTYHQLDTQARSIAAQLQHMNIQAGARALLFYPQGVNYIAGFFGCLYAGIIAVPAPHPHPSTLNRHLLRLQSIVDNAQPTIILTTAHILTRSQQLLTHFPFLHTRSWLATDTLSSSNATAWREPSIQSTTLALLQYTSGSTAVPKGVMLSHGNILHNTTMFQHVLQHPPGAPFVSWLPLFHDMGLIASALQALSIGVPCILLSPQSFIQRPIRWLQAISHYRAHTSCAPNFAYDLCVRKTTPEQRATLNLSCWKMAINGSEPVQQATLERFVSAFSPCGFHMEAFSPGYGLAEATVFVSGAAKQSLPLVHSVDRTALEHNQIVPTTNVQQNAQALVGCGQTSPDQCIAIVDPLTHTRCPTDRIGEIWISGPSVAQGYWNRPEETINTFQAYLTDTEEGPFLRTGDLGYLKDGQLFITGRLKDVIIIDGRNHYPQDIEQTVEHAHPAIRPACCAAFSMNQDGQERLVVVAEVERHYRPERQPTPAESTPAALSHVIRAIRRAISEQHDISVSAVALLKPARIPKTSSGKIQRHACRDAFLTHTLDTWDIQ